MCAVSVFVYLVLVLYCIINSTSGQGSQLKYVWGDALDDPLASGPNGEAYPWDLVSKIATKQRNSRAMLFPSNAANVDDPQILQNLISPQQTRQMLLNTFGMNNDNYMDTIYSKSTARSQSESEIPDGYTNNNSGNSSATTTNEAEGQGHGQRKGRASLLFNDHSKRRRKAKVQDSHHHWRQQQRQDLAEGCVPSRLCASTYNTTAPLYGISLTSGKPVTIVQKFPDLLQQVVFQVCKQTDCEVLQGECIQTYLPYLFLVLPLGPVTLTGQDYILVESGCVCQPKYARKLDHPAAPLPLIQPLTK